MGFQNDNERTTRYRIVVRGEIKNRITSDFDCPSVESAYGLTTLDFDVRDDSHLCGIIDRFRDLDVDIVSAEVVPNPPSPP